jgi:dTDP-4-dehydrorhamnose reductase
MKILLTGANGQLGREICRSQFPQGTKLIAPTRAELDLMRPNAIAGFVRQADPDLVINAAAFSSIDRAEAEPGLAFRINRDAASALASAAADCGASIVHISTDHVFDGSKDGPWSEDDSPNPLNVYGESKLAGELGVMAANPRHLILRVSCLYAAHGNNFVRSMLRLGRERSRLAIVCDRIGRPTAARDLAGALIGMALQTMNGEGGWGIYHFSNSGAPISRHGFASAIFCKAASWSGMPPILEPVGSEVMGARAARPRNSVLDLSKVERVFGLTPRPWPTALADVLDELRLEAIEAKAS